MTATRLTVAIAPPDSRSTVTLRSSIRLPWSVRSSVYPEARTSHRGAEHGIPVPDPPRADRRAPRDEDLPQPPQSALGRKSHQRERERLEIEGVAHPELGEAIDIVDEG